jgi:hypothetical protein
MTNLQIAHETFLLNASEEDLLTACAHSLEALDLVGEDSYTHHAHLHMLADYMETLDLRFRRRLVSISRVLAFYEVKR